MITLNCCQIDLLKLFHGGFSTGHGFLREPNSIRSYASLACIAIQSNQNDMFGGQSINAFDYAMAEGVKKSFKKIIAAEVSRACEFCEITPAAEVNFSVCTYSEKENPAAVENLTAVVGTKKLAEKIYRQACRDVEEETHQAMEALIHNFNTLHSRAGAQVPFSSINYGMDTSPEGRLATNEVLNAIQAGLGNGETPIFPISVFQLKAGVNYNPEDPNYDLFRLAMEVSAKRLFPNFSFLDAPYNMAYYKPGRPETEVAVMGCRTRVLGNIYDKTKQISPGRGNLSFTSLNLPRLGIEAHGSVSNFYDSLDKMTELIFEQLMDRYELISRKHVYNYPFLMGQGIWLDSGRLDPDSCIADVIKHGTMSVGFIGLAECLVALTGKHHGESAAAQQLGLEIIGHLRELTDKRSESTGLNFSLFSTPAEGLSGRFVKKDRNIRREQDNRTKTN